MLIIYFMVRYRRRHVDEVGLPERAPIWLEIGWSVIPLVIALAMFVWGARVFFDIYRPPADAVEYYGVGKQWMWKFQHPDGPARDQHAARPGGPADQAEDDQSEDVIHSFFVPAFRVKQDAVPGPLHDGLVRGHEAGRLPPVLRRVLRRRALPDDRQRRGPWSRASTRPGWPAAPTGQSDGGLGRRALPAARLQHLPPRRRHGAAWRLAPRRRASTGIFGNQVALADGRTRRRRRELPPRVDPQPQAKVWPAASRSCPPTRGRSREEQLMQLIAYIQAPSGDGGAETAATQP